VKAVGRLGGWAVGTLLASAIVLTAYPANRLFAQGFPTRPPRPARLAPVRFPPFTETRLANGLDVIVIEHHEQPVLSVSLSFRAGDAYDPAGKNGLAELVAELLSKGTGTRTAEQIAETIEGVGGSLSASSNQDFLTVSVDALSDDAQLAFDLLGDVTLHSTFPASELDLARTRALSALALQLSEPASLADRFFAQELYGRHPYARHPTAESYKAVTRDDVVTFAAQRLRPAGSLVVVAGDVTAAQEQDLIAKTFGSWRGATPGALPPGAVPSKTATDILLVHRPGSAQSNIIAGNTTILPTDAVYYAGRLVPARDRDSESDRRPGGELPAAGPGRRLPAPVPRASERGDRAAGSRGRAAPVPAPRPHDRRGGGRDAGVRPAQDHRAGGSGG